MVDAELITVLIFLGLPYFADFFASLVTLLLYCFPPKFLDPPRLPVWRHIVTGKSLGSLVQISKGYDSYLDERGRGKAKKLGNILM